MKIIGIVGGVILIVIIVVLLSRDGNGTGISQVDLNTDDGTATVYFTEEAIDQGASFTITAKTLAVSLPVGFDLVGNHIYEITCSTTTFSENIAISLPIPGGIKPQLAYAIVLLDNNNWTYIGGSLDRSQDTITARVNHLSDFAVVSAEEPTNPSECTPYDSLECQNAVANFEFENENVSVFSVPCPLGEVDLESVIVSQTCGTVLSYALGGSVVPGIGTVVGAIGGWIAVNLEQFNPVRIAPLTEDVTALSDGQIEGSGLLDQDSVSAVIFLDFIETDRDLDYIQRLKKLEVHVSDRIGIAFHEVYPLLSQDEVRSLDPCKSYIIFPKKPFDIPDKAKQLGEIYLEAIAYWELSWTRHLRDSHAQTMRVDLDEVWIPTPEEEEEPEPETSTQYYRLFGVEGMYRITHTMKTTDECYLVAAESNDGWAVMKISDNGDELWSYRYVGEAEHFLGMTELQNSKYYVMCRPWGYSGEEDEGVTLDKEGKEEEIDVYDDTLVERKLQCVTDDSGIVANIGGAMSGVYVFEYSGGRTNWSFSHEISNNEDMIYRAENLRATSDNGFIVTGECHLWEGFTTRHVFLLKLDETGNKEWGHIYESSTSDIGQSVCERRGGGYIIVGTSERQPLLIVVDEYGSEIKRQVYDNDIMEDFQGIEESNEIGYMIFGEAESWEKPLFAAKVDEYGEILSGF